VREAAGALIGLGVDPSGLVTSCRRIVERHLAVGPLWWLCARVLTAPDGRSEARRCAAESAEDTTCDELVRSLPDGATVAVIGWPSVAGDALVRRGDCPVLVVDVFDEGSGLVRRLERADVEVTEVGSAGLAAAVSASGVLVLEASAVGPNGALAVAGSLAAAAVARHSGVPVWLVAGVGTLLPARMWDAMCSRVFASEEPWDLDDEVVPFDLIDAIIGPNGRESPAEALRRTDCPVAPELFRSTAF
jgi:translation initiation factor 2B subunit (eIF-2B alpha/beta/delta family)